MKHSGSRSVHSTPLQNPRTLTVAPPPGPSREALNASRRVVHDFTFTAQIIIAKTQNVIMSAFDDLEEGEPPVIDPYEVLGLDRSATADQVKSAYRKAALKNHPGMLQLCRPASLADGG